VHYHSCPPVGSWLKNSFIDFPGTVSTVLFFNGCNLRCPYCHNCDLATGVLPPIDQETIFSFLHKRAGVIDGVVLSGGEPAIHGELLVSYADAIRNVGMKIKLDTNGLLPHMIPRIAPDYLALDLKTTPNRYRELGWRGSDPETLLNESLSVVRSMGKSAEVRITAAAPFIDDAVIATFCGMLEGIHAVYLQPFVDSGTCIDRSRVAPIDMPTLERYRSQIAGVVGHCSIRGR